MVTLIHERLDVYRAALDFLTEVHLLVVAVAAVVAAG